MRWELDGNGLRKTMTLDDVVDACVHLLFQLGRRYCSFNHLFKTLVRDIVLPLPVTEEMFKAAIVVGCSTGRLECDFRGLPASDGSPWVLLPVGLDGERGEP